MSVRKTSSSSSSYSYSASSLTGGSSSRSLSQGLQLLGGGQSLVSTGKGRALSMYEGSGGFGTRVSQGYSFSSGSEGAVINNEKLTMQNLNDRLATYLEKVRSLESANRTLELQIREFYEKKAPSIAKDYSAYFATISDLRAQIMKRSTDNQRIILQIDNAQLAAEDFKIKFETEANMHSMVQADVQRLRGVRDNLTLTIKDLGLQLEGLKEELAYMKSNHEEDMRAMRIKQTGNVNVEVDSPESVDLSLVLQEMRESYEAQMVKNKQELEKWFQNKVENLQTTIVTCSTEVKTFSTELSELKRTYQSLEISRQSLFSEVQCMQQNLDEVKSKYSVQLSQMQVTINSLEAELQNLRASLEQQKSEYNILLDIKMRLELEIAEYRRLLEGELRTQIQETKKAVIISKVVEVEEHKPHIERRVKTIVEEIIDGKVVSSVVDTQVEDIQ